MKPTFKQSAQALAFVAIFFYATYLLTNWVSSLRAPLPEIVFSWERYIPFISASILPYWSLTPLYGAAIFLCRSKDEQTHLLRQLIAAQLVAVVCFLIFPLQMTWQKPPVEGLLGGLFSSVAMFDMPYNQAPSLHVMLALIVGAFYWRRFEATGIRTAVLVWFSLIGVSALTTWQHHFIDVPTAIFAASWIMWWLPENQNAPEFQRPNHFSHTKYAAFYVFGTIILLILANFLTWWLIWAAMSCLIVAMCYACFGATAFQKQSNGTHTLAVRILLLPYQLVGNEIAYYWTQKHRRSQITPKIELASIHAKPYGAAVLDLCAEYAYRHHDVSVYVSLPWLDLVTPSVEDLRKAAIQLQHLHETQGDVIVCCALGYGRSAAVVITWLATYGGMENVSQAYDLVKKQRPQIRLSNDTLQHIEWACLTIDKAA